MNRSKSDLGVRALRHQMALAIGDHHQQLACDSAYKAVDDAAAFAGSVIGWLHLMRSRASIE